MNFQRIRDEEIVLKHKDLIKRLRLLEFDFHTLFLNRGTIIAPYYEQMVIPSEENGYSLFLLDLQTLLREMEESGFMYKYVIGLREHYSRAFTQRGAREYIDYSLFNIITHVFTGFSINLAKMTGGTKKILKAIESLDIKETTDISPQEHKSMYQDIIRLLPYYSEEWLGQLPLMESPLTIEKVQSVTEDYEHLLTYFRGLSTVRKDTAQELEDNSLFILHNKGINLDQRMKEILNDAELHQLEQHSYSTPIQYSTIERAVVATSYLDILLKGVRRDIKQAEVHSDRILEMQAYLEIQLGYTNYFTKLHERHMLDLEEALNVARENDDKEEIERLRKKLDAKYDARDFAYAQIENKIPYAENLDEKQQLILALLASIYREYGQMIYHNPQRLEFYADYSLRASKLFVQFHPKAHNEGYSEVFPFHIRDGVIERYLVESICNYNFKPLTMSDVLTILGKKNHKSEKVFDSYMRLQSATNKALDSYLDITQDLNSLKEDLHENEVFLGSLRNLVGVTNHLNSHYSKIHTESMNLRFE